MKYIIIALIFLCVFQFVKIEFSPFSLSLDFSSWKLLVGWVLVMIGIVIMNAHWYLEGQMKALDDVIEDLEERTEELKLKKQDELPKLEEHSSSVPTSES